MQQIENSEQLFWKVWKSKVIRNIILNHVDDGLKEYKITGKEIKERNGTHLHLLSDTASSCTLKLRANSYVQHDTPFLHKTQLVDNQIEIPYCDILPTTTYICKNIVRSKQSDIKVWVECKKYGSYYEYKPHSYTANVKVYPFDIESDDDGMSVELPNLKL